MITKWKALGAVSALAALLLLTGNMRSRDGNSLLRPMAINIAIEDNSDEEGTRRMGTERYLNKRTPVPIAKRTKAPGGGVDNGSDGDNNGGSGGDNNKYREEQQQLKKEIGILSDNAKLLKAKLKNDNTLDEEDKQNLQKELDNIQRELVENRIQQTEAALDLGGWTKENRKTLRTKLAALKLLQKRLKKKKRDEEEEEEKRRRKNHVDAEEKIAELKQDKKVHEQDLQSLRKQTEKVELDIERTEQVRQDQEKDQMDQMNRKVNKLLKDGGTNTIKDIRKVLKEAEDDLEAVNRVFREEALELETNKAFGDIAIDKVQEKAKDVAQDIKRAERSVKLEEAVSKMTAKKSKLKKALTQNLSDSDKEKVGNRIQDLDDRISEVESKLADEAKKAKEKNKGGGVLSWLLRAQKNYAERKLAELEDESDDDDEWTTFAKQWYKNKLIELEGDIEKFDDKKEKLDEREGKLKKAIDDGNFSPEVEKRAEAKLEELRDKKKSQESIGCSVGRGGKVGGGKVGGGTKGSGRRLVEGIRSLCSFLGEEPEGLEYKEPPPMKDQVPTSRGLLLAARINNIREDFEKEQPDWNEIKKSLFSTANGLELELRDGFRERDVEDPSEFGLFFQTQKKNIDFLMKVGRKLAQHTLQESIDPGDLAEMREKAKTEKDPEAYLKARLLLYTSEHRKELQKDEDVMDIDKRMIVLHARLLPFKRTLEFREDMADMDELKEYCKGTLFQAGPCSKRSINSLNKLDKEMKEKWSKMKDAPGASDEDMTKYKQQQWIVRTSAVGNRLPDYLIHEETLSEQNGDQARRNKMLSIAKEILAAEAAAGEGSK